jgi:site-specific recombinase XerD
MLKIYYSAPKTLARLRTGPSEPYIDGFAAYLADAGYAASSAVRYLRAAAHLGHFLESQGMTFAELDAGIAQTFRQHLPRCRCPLSNGGKVNHHTFFGIKRFHRYLIGLGVCADEPLRTVATDEPALIIGFRHWLEVHRGAAPPTRKHYCRYASELLDALGDEPVQWTPQQVRKFFLSSGECASAHTLENQVTAVRAFLRYLIAQDRCRSDLDQVVPRLARWRLASLPPSLSTEQVEHLLAACEGDSLRRVRDRAIVLLLLRLGLRASDVARMRLRDIDWDQATVRVSGKGRYEVILPLPQDVGDALLHYLERRPQFARTDRVFVGNIVPFGPFTSSDAVSSVVKRALTRAEVKISVKGAHLLRHTAATQMLRQGVPLEQIGSVLRHRGVDTTAYYAKVDEDLLRRVVQPWPEVVR